MAAKNKVDSRLVSETIEKLRDHILQQAPDAYLGSMNEIADLLGVGIVTIQQAARILEYEGLLIVRRGPGGGYYGSRPDAAALERAFATYLRIHNINYRDAFEMTVSLDCDLAEAAAESRNPEFDALLHALVEELDACTTAEQRIEFEIHFRNTLFAIADKPLLELLAQVAMQLYKAESTPTAFAEQISLQEWKAGRMNMLLAIAARDTELAAFEAHRFRRQVRGWMKINR